MDSLPLVFSSGWTSGVNAYATVLMLGLLGRLGGVDRVPDALERTEVLAAAAVLFSIELVADKVPYVDSIWDAIHTPIRPGIGAAIGLLIAGETEDIDALIATALGGTTALLSHAVKASVRLAVNLSPEPFSNIAISTTEDLTVAGMAALAVSAPWLAAAIAAVLLILGLIAVWIAARAIRRFWRRRSASAER